MRVCAFCGAESPAGSGTYCQSCGFRIRALPSRGPDARASPPGISSTPRTRQPSRPTHRIGRSMLLVIAAMLLFILCAVPELLAGSAQESVGSTPTETLTQTVASLQTVATVTPGISPDPNCIAGYLSYLLDDELGTIPFQIHRQAYQETAAETIRFSGDEQQYYLQILDDPVQRPDLAALADRIRSITDDPEDQARIAVSAVQQIPYDTAKAELESTGQRDRYPLEVLHDGQGLCGEKSVLLASLLRDLGFGVALFEFKPEQHMAVGIACPAGYDYAGTGYAFIESTEPSIITDSDGTYAGIGRLSSTPVVIPIASGSAFTGIGEEAADAKEWRSLQSMGKTLDEYHYARYLLLKQKYGLITTDS